MQTESNGNCDIRPYRLEKQQQLRCWLSEWARAREREIEVVKKRHTPCHNTCTAPAYISPLENHILFARMSIFLDDCLRLDVLDAALANGIICIQSIPSSHPHPIWHDARACICVVYKRIFSAVDYNLLHCRAQIKKGREKETERAMEMYFVAWIYHTDAICDEIRFNLIKLMGKELILIVVIVIAIAIHDYYLLHRSLVRSLVRQLSFIAAISIAFICLIIVIKSILCGNGVCTHKHILLPNHNNPSHCTETETENKLYTL